MNANNIAKEIIRLPETYYALGNISIYSLLKKTGYFEVYNQLDEIIILQEIINNPHCINQWLEWSNNKRTTPGWYFKKIKSTEHIVGYFNLVNNSNLRKYSNSNEACAAFIKREIEEIRKN